MKSLVVIIGLICVLPNVEASDFGVNLEEKGMMLVDDLVDMGAKYVQCENQLPKCIIKSASYIGIQYEGQTLDEVSDIRVANSFKAVIELKEQKICR